MSDYRRAEGHPVNAWGTGNAYCTQCGVHINVHGPGRCLDIWVERVICNRFFFFSCKADDWVLAEGETPVPGYCTDDLARKTLQEFIAREVCVHKVECGRRAMGQEARIELTNTCFTASDNPSPGVGLCQAAVLYAMQFDYLRKNEVCL